MLFKVGRVCTFSAIAIMALTTAQAQQSSPAGPAVVETGKYDYEEHCAVCHGFNGKGDGIFSSLLKSGTVVPNLTELSKKNNGVFPFTHVYGSIDGTVPLSAHGSKEMPIWGPRFKAETAERFYDILRIDREAIVRARILALTEYIYRLQAQ